MKIPPLLLEIGHTGFGKQRFIWKGAARDMQPGLTLLVFSTDLEAAEATGALVLRSQYSISLSVSMSPAPGRKESHLHLGWMASHSSGVVPLSSRRGILCRANQGYTSTVTPETGFGNPGWTFRNECLPAAASRAFVACTALRITPLMQVAPVRGRLFAGA